MKRTRVNKTPIDPGRVRRLPAGGFSWIDRRFVREGFPEDLPREATLLYLFLVAVSDAEGLSFYADPTVERFLKLNAEELTQARYWLEKADLILYRDPLYQVLALPSKRPRFEAATSGPRSTHAAPTAAATQDSRRRGGDVMSLREFLALTTQQRSGEPDSRRKP